MELFRAYLGRVEGLDAQLVGGLVVLSSVAAALVLGRAAVRSSGVPRRAWAVIALTCLIWGCSFGAAIAGAPGWVVTEVGRPLSLLSLTVGMLMFPGVARSLRDWLVVACDGWMMVGGWFVVLWMLLHHPGLSPVAINPSEAVWLLLDCVVLSVVAGLLTQVDDADRWPVFYVLVAGLIGGAGDMVAAITGSMAPGWSLWAVTILMIGIAPLVGNEDMFTTTFVDRGRHRQIRFMQLPWLPAVVFLYGPVEPDAVATLAAAGVLIVCFLNVASAGRQNVRLLAEVRSQGERYEALLRDSGEPVLQLGADGRISYLNQAAGNLLGLPVEALPGRMIQDWFHPEDLDGALRAAAALRDGRVEVARFDVRLRHASGQWRHAETTLSHHRGDHGYVFSPRDVTERESLRRELQRQASTDPLTGLANRAAFLQGVQERLDRGLATAVLFVDLDRFKMVNDTLGHAAGDALLRAVGERLSVLAGPEDLASRLGGDEFALMLGAGGPLTDDGALQRARALHAALDDLGPAGPGSRLWGSPASAGASVGVATASGGSAEDLLRDADLAMYHAKKELGGGVARYETALSERVVQRSRMLGRLEAAVAGHGLRLELQPVVQLSDGAWTGFEALIRWDDDGVGRSPDEFVPLAEESGLIVPMGTWVLQEALRQLASWPDPAAGIAVNVSPQQLEQEGFAAGVLASLARAGIAPDRLTLEITEQTAVADLTSTASRLLPLRERGVHVSVDDFGTGFSSMRYLTRLPVDALKIDRQFVDGLGRRGEDEVLVGSMLSLAAALKLEVVAEGVETREQAQRLRDLGCRYAQGYLFSRPRRLDDLRRERASRVPVQRAVTLGESVTGQR